MSGSTVKKTSNNADESNKQPWDTVEHVSGMVSEPMMAD